MIETKKSLGQHWLSDADALTAMCEAAEIGPEDTVLEIGPGLGTLTMFLVYRAKKVLAVEFDTALANNLEGVYSKLPEYRNKLDIVHADILKFDLNSLP